MHTLWKTYIDKQSVEKQKTLLDLLSQVQAIVPGVTPDMIYGVPGFRLNGKPLIMISTNARHVGIYPGSPEVVSQLVKHHPEIVSSTGTLKFAYDHLPSREIIEELLQFRKAEIV